MILIIKKEIYENWLSIKTCKRVPKIFYKAAMKWYEILGYEVEVLEE